MRKQLNDKVFFDTNILLYSTDRNDRRGARARTVLSSKAGVISVQVLNEFVAVARGKLRLEWKDVDEALAIFGELFPDPIPLTLGTHHRAMYLARRYNYSIYDSLILAAALESSCDVLYTEDLKDGQTIESLLIRNPLSFA